MHQPPSLAMATAGRTDVGRTRSRNEDSFGISEDAGVALVCDGMGGHAGGDVASRTAAEAIIDFVSEFQGTSVAPAKIGPTGQTDGVPVADVGVGSAVSVVRSAVQLANQRLLELNRERGFPDGRGMGTTVVGLRRVEPGDRLVAFHAGDSRLYRLRDGELRQLTRDHSLYQHWLDQGGRGPAPQRNIILRALGTMPDVDPEIGVHAVRPGDLFLLCSDGLTGMLPDDSIAVILRAVPSRSLDEACERLIALANERGGHDNITVVLARFTEAV
ncbi:PP2C family serine/threonine-protein phosphatase [Azospirillum sp. TSO22-1]|uniref:PP2C family protein-serine/threonine phosphatase n=1 Tax=Azospirillum sp. TSO22-1 TaxID=716789 RepID=UPI000D610240|nr:PP2C family serine/threonine-protein phosphatase [Azospirillum sp. TSO22-1]PWC30977.1 protein phosphatase [Azospirillum sp. TSO22-1]